MRALDYSYHYRKWHSDKPEHEALVQREHRRVLGPHLPTSKAARILDVGCGSGLALMSLRSMGYEMVLGVDTDAGQVQAARRRGLMVEMSANTGTWLLEHHAAFDFILAIDLIEHVPVAEQIDFVSALAGALSPSGCLLCRVPNANSSLAGRYRYIDWTHACSFTEHSLDFLLYHGGFKHIDVFATETVVRPRWWWLPVGGSRHWWVFRMVRLWRRLEMMAELGPDQGRTVPLSLNLLARARKA